jgi:hypothetical protein
MVKVVTIEATFPELKTGAMYQTGRGRGSSVRVAFAAAGRNLFKQPKLKAKRFTMFKATVSIGTEAEAPTEEQIRKSNEIGEY